MTETCRCPRKASALTSTTSWRGVRDGATVFVEQGHAMGRPSRIREGERTDEYDVPVEEGGELSEELGEVVKGLQVDVRANQLTQRS